MQAPKVLFFLMVGVVMFVLFGFLSISAWTDGRPVGAILCSVAAVSWVGIALVFYRKAVVREQIAFMRPRRRGFLPLRPNVNLGEGGGNGKPKPARHRVWNNPEDEE